jgi:DNA-binding MarR family transcriptional regulator
MDTAVKPQGCTNLKLRQLMRRVAQLYDAEVGKTGLRGTQYSLLSYVVKLGPVRPGDLARAMKVDASTLTRNLRPLIAAGLVTLGPGADGRSRLAEATSAGREKRQEAQRRWRVAQESLNQRLGVQRVLLLHTLLEECQELLADLPGGDIDD